MEDPWRPSTVAPQDRPRAAARGGGCPPKARGLGGWPVAALAVAVRGSRRWQTTANVRRSLDSDRRHSAGRDHPGQRAM